MARNIRQDEGVVAAGDSVGGPVARGHVVVAILSGDARKMRANLDPGRCSNVLCQLSHIREIKMAKNLNFTLDSSLTDVRRHRVQRDHLPQPHGPTDAGHRRTAHVPIRATHQGTALFKLPHNP